MIEKVVLLASYGYFEGGDIGDLLSNLESMGFFSYLLPFLLIFALVNGILSRMELFKGNKAVNGIIAFVVGLLALQFSIVPQFFAEIFPRLGVGLAIILVILILAGLFLDPKNKGITYGIMGLSMLIAIVVLVQTAGALGWSSGNWWYYNWKSIVGYIVIIVIFIVVLVGTGSKDGSSKGDDDESILARALRSK